MEGIDKEKSANKDGRDVEVIAELKKENVLLTAKCESLEMRSKASEEKIKTLEVCIYDFLKRVNTTEAMVKEKITENNNFEKRITELETKVANSTALYDERTNGSKISDTGLNEKHEKSEFKELTLERLTALENKVHDFETKFTSEGGESLNKKNISPTEKRVHPTLEQEDTSSSGITYCQFPQNVSGNISVTNEDYMCLRASQFLNDVMIDFFLKYLQFSNNGTVDISLMNKTHIFTTFFYNRLTTKPSTPKGQKVHPIEDNPDMTDSQKMYERVRKWTKRVDLFEKDFIVVPINDKAHWFVCIICYPGEVTNKADDGESNVEIDRRKPCILVFDSLPEGSKSDICSVLRAYLTMEWNTKRLSDTTVFTEENMPQYNPRVRGQKNSKDCGIFLLQYVESFFRTSSRDRDWTDGEADHRNWFHKDEVMKKRGKIAKLIRDMAVKQNYEKKSYKKLVFPSLDFQSVESPIKKSKLLTDLKFGESPREQSEEEPEAPVKSNEESIQETKVSSEKALASHGTLPSRDPRLARGKMVLLHKKGNQLSVNPIPEQDLGASGKKSGPEKDLSAGKSCSLEQGLSFSGKKSGLEQRYVPGEKDQMGGEKSGQEIGVSASPSAGGSALDLDLIASGKGSGDREEHDQSAGKSLGLDLDLSATDPELDIGAGGKRPGSELQLNAKKLRT